MKKLIFILLNLLSTVTYVQAAEEISFRAEAPEAVVSGQQFQVQYIINDRASERDFRAPEFTGFDVLFGPAYMQSINSSFGAGGSRSEINVTFTYTLMAGDEGTYNIAPATIKVKGKQYTSNPLVVKVLKADKVSDETGEAATSTQQVGRGKSFLVLQLSKRKVYEQEAIQATLKLYFNENVSSITSADFPTFEGFAIQELEQPKEGYKPTLETYNDRNYQSVVLKKWVLFPQHSGKLEIGNSKIGIAVQVPRPRTQIRSIFDDMFESYQTVNREVSSGAVSVDVEPLPFGKPASYMNAVGKYTISSSISSTHVKANEAVTVKLVIKGTGNLKYVKTPEIKFPDDFETYDPNVDVVSVPTSAGLQGEKVVEYTVIPRFGGNFTIPGVEFSYFDTESKSYKTLTTESYELTVEKGKDDGENAAVSNFSNKEALKLLGQDIRYIDVKPMKVSKEPHLIFGTLGYWLFYFIPALLFAVFVFIYRKQARENADIALMRTKKANKVATRRLKLAGKYLKEHQKELFYDEVMKATWGYLSDKLSIPISELTKDNVEAELEKYGVDSDSIRRFMDILNTCEFARYAPVQSETAMDDLYAETVKAIGKMESTVKK